MIDVSVIIVNYNTKELTANCINSIIKYTNDLSYEIVLVDNNSTDGSKEYFEKDTRLNYIYSFENLGFGRANNIGMILSKGKYVLLLNSDTLLENNALKLFYDYAESNEKLAIYGAWLRDIKGRIIHSYGQIPTIKSELINALQVYTSRLKFIKKRCDFKEKSNVKTLEVGYITGADLFFSRTIFEKYGAFDYRFFMYYEESDWERRLDDFGIRRLIINSPRIVHLEGGSQSSCGVKNMPKNLKYTKSMFIYLRKHYSLFYYLYFRILYLILRFFPILFSEYTIKEKITYLILLLN